MAKKLSIFTQTLLGLESHKAGNGYPKCPIHESRRISTEELKQMEQVDYDHIGNHYEIYRKESRTNKRGGFYTYYNYRGREVERFYPPMERKRKPKKGNPEVLIDDKPIEHPKWVEVKSNWSQQDINEYIDSLGDEIIKKTDYWWRLPENAVEIPSIVLSIKEDVNLLISYNRKCDRGDYSKANELAKEMVPIYERLISLLPQIEDKDATLVRSIVADLERTSWLYALSSALDHEEIRKPMNELRHCDVLRIKEVKWEYKKRLYEARISDGEPIARAIGYDILRVIQEQIGQ